MNSELIDDTLNLLVLASSFAISPEQIKEGVGYRYVGFYGSLISSLFRKFPKASVFWYSVKDNSLRVINKDGFKKCEVSMMRAVIRVVAETFRNKSYLEVILAYPSALPRVNRIFEYFFTLLFFRLFSVRRLRLIVDDFDPPVEAIYAFCETEPSFVAVTYARLMEKITLTLASSVVVISEFWKNYMVQVYGIKEDKLTIVSNGSLIRLIPYSFKNPKDSITVLYAGSARKVKDIDKLVTVIENMRAQGMAIELIIAGAKLMVLPSWVHVQNLCWKDFVSMSLVKSDICVIPYPPHKFTFFHSMPAKLFDYMAAGKPVVSTNLNDVSDIIRSNECGLVARDWTELQSHIKKLYEERLMAKKLGNNARLAAEKYFDYEKIAESFLEKMIIQLMNKKSLRRD